MPRKRPTTRRPDWQRVLGVNRSSTMVPLRITGDGRLGGGHGVAELGVPQSERWMSSGSSWRAGAKGARACGGGEKSATAIASPVRLGKLFGQLLRRGCGVYTPAPPRQRKESRPPPSPHLALCTCLVALAPTPSCSRNRHTQFPAGQKHQPARMKKNRMGGKVKLPPAFLSAPVAPSFRPARWARQLPNYPPPLAVQSCPILS